MYNHSCSNSNSKRRNCSNSKNSNWKYLLYVDFIKEFYYWQQVHNLTPKWVRVAKCKPVECREIRIQIAITIVILCSTNQLITMWSMMTHTRKKRKFLEKYSSKSVLEKMKKEIIIRLVRCKQNLMILLCIWNQ